MIFRWLFSNLFPCLQPSILNDPHHGVMGSMFTSSAVDHRFEFQSGQTMDYEIGICCVTANHSVLRRKSKDWLLWNRDNVSQVEQHVYPLTVFFQWAGTMKIQLGLLVSTMWTSLSFIRI